jgi:hypothetical protein
MRPDGILGPTDRRPRTSRRALLRYAATWLLAGLAAALVVLLVIRGSADLTPRRGADPIAAVVASGCVLEAPRGRPAELSRPPVAGPPARPLADGVYRSAWSRERLVGTLRRGVVVIQYQRTLSGREVAAIERAFRATAPRRVVVPDGSRMTFAVAATAWGRVLGCSKLDGRVIRALRTFAFRYGGRGPEAG